MSCSLLYSIGSVIWCEVTEGFRTADEGGRPVAVHESCLVDSVQVTMLTLKTAGKTVGVQLQLRISFLANPLQVSLFWGDLFSSSSALLYIGLSLLMRLPHRKNPDCIVVSAMLWHNVHQAKSTSRVPCAETVPPLGDMISDIPMRDVSECNRMSERNRIFTRHLPQIPFLSVFYPCLGSFSKKYMHKPQAWYYTGDFVPSACLP